MRSTRLIGMLAALADGCSADGEPSAVSRVEIQQTGLLLTHAGDDRSLTAELFAFVVTTLLPIDLLSLELGNAVASSNQTKLSLIGTQSCALLPTGKIKCWGHGRAVFEVPGIIAKAFAEGSGHSCAVLTGGAIQCWGENGSGQLGNGETTFSATPVSVVGISNAVAVTVGNNHTCALLLPGDVKCWGGDNVDSKGVLGNGTNVGSLVPITAAGIVNAVAIAAGNEHTCAVLVSGSLRCWGRNDVGQLGSGVFGPDSCDGTPCSTTPIAVTGISNAATLAISPFCGCAVLRDGTVKCWGHNDNGELGDGTIDTTATPHTVLGLTGISSVATGSQHTCAQATDGALHCWGDNRSGQFGNGTKTSSRTAIAIAGITTTAIGLGGSHSCGVFADGAMKCWGANFEGQLGNFTITESTTPVTVVGVP